MAETVMDSTIEAPENGQIEPQKSEASVISDDYDPSIPTDEKGSVAEFTPSKMKVAELRTELMNRGLDAKGNKAALVQRLEEALDTPQGEVSTPQQPGDEDNGDEEDEDEVTMITPEDIGGKDQEIGDLEMLAPLQSKEESGEGDVDAVEEIDDEGESSATENIEEQGQIEMEMETETAAAGQEQKQEEPMEQEPTEKPTSKPLVPKAKPAEVPAAKEKPKQEPKVVAKPQEKVVEKSKPAKGATKAPAAKAKEETKKPEVEKGPPPELQKYWKAVKDKPTDFTGWTYLLQYVEQQGHMPSVRDAFDAFLARYPYCYGYWKKYADLERKKAKNTEKAQEVFETGMKAIPLSSDLWMQYIQFVGQTASPEEVTDRLRSVYSKAIAAAGTDFRSDKLWDMYINFEKDKQEWQRVTKVYDQLLTIPTQLYSHHFEKFKEHIKKHHPKDSLSVDEFIKLRMEVVEVLGVVEPGIEEGDEGGDDAPPGDDDAPPGVEIAPPGLETPAAKKAASSKQVEMENEAIRKKVLESRGAVYRQTEQEVSKRWAYEEGIRRPYFHAKPLEKSQLKNWREYLDFETANGTHERVLILYERCLVACALYEEFWMRYAKYLEPHSIEGVSSVYKRACSIHLPKKPSIHLRWAAFEEKQGNMTAAQEILQKLEENVPDLLMVSLERLSLERRLGNKEEVVGILRKRMGASKKPEIKAFFAMKLSRYYAKVMNDIDNARKVLQDAVQWAKDKVTLYLQMLDLEMQQIPSDEQAILDLLQKGIEVSKDMDDKMKFSQRRLTYLMDFGTDVAKLQTAYESHQVLLKEQLEILQVANKKRSAETSESTPAATPAKKAKTEDSKASTTPTPTTPTTAATPSKPHPLLSNPVSNPSGPAAAQDYNQPPGPNPGWGGYNQPQYGPQGGNYGPVPPGPGGYNQPPPNSYNQQYQQYQQAWGNYNQGYYPR
ncbi:pre-mRNA-processing factor 39-like isoform X2 [Patiria miniata]|uniref:Pre-mRNA-processing factor 39 n=1 Tax=Patiria miniata TaxID=46514 RepID=A0A914BCA3_PATMI|nr:pre-mRNA-processing factor 39-like isoform X2 [Patiria miniata]